MYKVCVSREFLVDEKKKFVYWEGEFEDKQSVVWLIERVKFNKDYFDKTIIKVSKGKDKKFFVF